MTKLARHQSNALAHRAQPQETGWKKGNLSSFGSANAASRRGPWRKNNSSVSA